MAKLYKNLMGDNSKIDDSCINLKDRIIEQSSHYRKWESGILEQWGVNNITVTHNTAWGSLHYYATSGVNFPLTFIDTPSLTYKVRSPQLFIEGNASITKANFAPRLLHINAGAGTSVGVTWYAIGRWK